MQKRINIEEIEEILCIQIKLDYSKIYANENKYFSFCGFNEILLPVLKDGICISLLFLYFFFIQLINILYAFVIIYFCIKITNYLIF